ncbi:MAG: aminotransferase class I/II-fold pyridoxal phosphate-dependent enzyme [Chloroflexi bacterium]|nr:aminotransferase class I/II-fold pyridoxal phosphate-dependent enzyme [Chloroflexota bacterium]
MPTFAQRVAPFGTTIFTEINQLAARYNAVNLGQGRPDFDGPQAIIDAAVAALRSDLVNQYAPSPGLPALREGVARHAEVFYGLTVDPESGVIVTAGATQGVFSAIMGLVDPGDEVIVIEPYYDSYVPGIQMAGGVPVYVPMHPPNWTLDEQELRAAFNDNTRALILNTPNNPSGRVYTRAELQLLADLCIQHDVIVISDEVYEHLYFEGHQHIAIASLPGMFERTVTIGSAGKTFGMTGWKIGWVYGAPELITGVWRSHQFVTFATNHPTQVATAYAFTLGSGYYEEYQALYSRKRDLVMQVLDAAGMSAMQPEGTYFIMGDFSAVFDGNDVEFCKHLIQEIGVATIPPSAYFSARHRHHAENHVRFAFCKSDETLERAAERMRKLRLG